MKKTKSKIEELFDNLADSIVKNRLKKSLQESNGNISEWINMLFECNHKCDIPYLPSNNKTLVLYDFFSLKLKGRTTIKQAFDFHNEIIKEKLDDDSLNCFENWKNEAKKIKTEDVLLYLNFRDEASRVRISDSKSLSKENKELAKSFVEGEVNEDFIKFFIPTIVNIAHTGAMITHAAKFSHPAADCPKLFITKNSYEDGFIKTGNATVDFDIHVNAANLKLYRFLSLVINRKTVKEHMLSDSKASVLSLFSSDEEVIKNWQDSFLKCLNSQNEKTSQLIKQVYFPVKDNYHLLSIVFPSSLAFELRKRIEAIKYSDETIIAKRGESKGVFNEQGYSVIPNLTLYRHGGDHPKNISALNNKYQDVYLLDSCPPQLKALNKNLPKKDFFKSSLWRKSFLTELRGLHRLLRAESEIVPKLRTELLDKYLQTNPDAKSKLIKRSKASIDEGIQPHHLKVLFNIIIESILHNVIEKIWRIRAEEQGWTLEKRFKSLPKKQKILLDQHYITERLQTEDWFNYFIDKLISWIIESYKEELADKQLPLTKEHKEKMKKVLIANKGGLL